jgi:DNA repair protein RadA/Sms
VALASATRQVAAPMGVVAMGEIGLAGELRRVRDLPQRIAEAARLGFAVAVVPVERRAPDSAPDLAPVPRTVEGMRVIEVPDVASALRLLGVIRDTTAEAV